LKKQRISGASSRNPDGSAIRMIYYIHGHLIANTDFDLLRTVQNRARWIPYQNHAGIHDANVLSSVEVSYQYGGSKVVTELIELGQRGPKRLSTAGGCATWEKLTCLGVPNPIQLDRGPVCSHPSSHRLANPIKPSTSGSGAKRT
jgi:hypothetical protein